MSRIRQRLGDDRGFTLIELLVVVLIIGILAAIAIPAFLGQRSKSQNVAAKSAARTAGVAAHVYGIDHSDSYSGMALSDLQQIEPSLQDSSALNGAVTVLAATSTGYTVYAPARTGTYYVLTRANGATLRCSTSTVPTAACTSSSTPTW